MPRPPHRSPAALSPVALLRFVRQDSQEALAERAGVSAKTIGRVERGELPRMRTAVAIAEALDSPLSTLFPFNDDGPAPKPTRVPTSGSGVPGNAVSG